MRSLVSCVNAKALCTGFKHSQDFVSSITKPIVKPLRDPGLSLNVSDVPENITTVWNLLRNFEEKNIKRTKFRMFARVFTRMFESDYIIENRTNV